MITSIDYQALQDFSGLAEVRKSCALKENGIQINNIPSLCSKYSQLLANASPGLEVKKMDLVNSIKYSSGVIPEIMESLHKISQEIFKNLSHALELPWEKYLGEMHEFAAPSKDRFRVVNSTDTIPNDWSTLTVAVNAASPETAFVIYGVALSVFSEGITPIPSSLDFGACSGYGDWLIYHVCPNDDVFYTRTAGALMTPLSCEEYESRKRVRELQFV